MPKRSNSPSSLSDNEQRRRSSGITDHRQTIRILLADDHPLTRQGIRAILEETPDIQVVGEAQDGFQVIPLVEGLQPDVLLLDLIMPGPRPFEIENYVRTHFPHIITLVLTAHDRDCLLSRSVDAGVVGFLTKEEPPHRLIEAIRRAVSGENLLTAEQIDRIAHWKEETGQRWASLSKRERDVLRLLVRGQNNAEIAAELGIATRTVECHITHILQKLGVTSRQQAIAWVINHDVPDD